MVNGHSCNISPARMRVELRAPGSETSVVLSERRTDVRDSVVRVEEIFTCDCWRKIAGCSKRDVSEPGWRFRGFDFVHHTAWIEKFDSVWESEINRPHLDKYNLRFKSKSTINSVSCRTPGASNASSRMSQNQKCERWLVLPRTSLEEPEVEVISLYNRRLIEWLRTVDRGNLLC